MSIKNYIKTNSITQIAQNVTNAGANKFASLLKKDKKAIGISAGAVFVATVCTIVALSIGGGASETPIIAKVDSTTVQTTSNCAIVVDGKTIATLATKEEAQAVLDSVTVSYQTEGAEIISQTYTEDVTLKEVSADEADLLTKEEAVAMILTGTKEPKTYTVQSGDSFWTIAHDNGIKVSELQAANPDISPDRLRIGSTLNLFEIKPYIHLTLTEKLTASVNIEYAINYESTDKLYKGETQVKTAGTYGKKEVTSEIVSENGKVISTTEIASQVVSEPLPQTVLKGTKSLSLMVGTGSFTSPMSHLEISSAFGSRGGSRHTGVDLRNPKGTAIFVVDDGVVTHASYQGSYGNLVVVSHGDGVETYYAHCDSMTVSVGDVVRKGDKIGTVGITGRATGYHLHFEVRVNGTPKNPMNYL